MKPVVLTQHERKAYATIQEQDEKIRKLYSALSFSLFIAGLEGCILFGIGYFVWLSFN